MRSVFDSVESGNTTVYVPAMVFAEIMYVLEKQKISISLSEVADYLKQYSNYKEYPMTFAVIQTASQITDVPELHDRLIAGPCV